MAEDTVKVYKPSEIQDQPFPQEGQEASLATSEGGKDETYKPAETKDRSFPEKKVAVELLSTALNTRSKKILAEFQFTPSGSLQIGDYKEGVTGDVRISPSGIVARDSAGNTTFTLDGTTGDAIFKGTIQTGTLISGLVIVGNNRVVIDGENKRILIYDDSGIPRILLGYHQDGF